MGKRLERSNFRIEVEPRSPGDFGHVSFSGAQRSEEETLRECEDIADQIRRHVDGLPTRGRRGVSVIWDSEHVCQHCGALWTEDGDTYNGGCCTEDESNIPADEHSVAE